MEDKEVLEVEVVKEKKTRVRLDKQTWNKIKMEWCLKGTSHRELAEKYGIGRNTIEKRSVREDWALYKLNNKVERTEAIIDYCSQMVGVYRQLQSILIEDITKDNLAKMEWKDKKILIECLKLSDNEVTRHLMISEE